MTRGPQLYFAYDATIDPDRLSGVAPGAEFLFIAHLPEWRLTFPIPNGKGSLPSVHPESGNTVWGAVFQLPAAEVAGLNEAQESEGRVPTTVQAMDREGRRHDVLVHVAEDGRRFHLFPRARLPQEDGARRAPLETPRRLGRQPRGAPRGLLIESLHTQ